MYIGIDIGGSHIAVGLFDEYKKLSNKKELEISLLKENNPAEKLVKEIINLINYIVEENTIKESEIQEIGVSAPGTIKNGVIVKASNLNIRNFNLVKSLEEYFGVKCKLRNDAKCAAVAEKEYGILKNVNDAVFLNIGTGIGGAVFYKGNLIEPVRFSGLEFGHMVINKNGEKCTCGRNGCFETEASMKILKRKIKNKLNLKESTTGKEIRDLLEIEQNLEICNDIIEEYINNLSIGIANIINIFEPEVLAIGGSFAHYEKILLENLIDKLQENQLLFNDAELPKIVMAELKNDAGLLGAIL